MSHLKVAVRVRPLSERELNLNAKDVVQVETQQTIGITNLKVPEQNAGDSRERVRRFTFDYCFNKESTQDQIFDVIDEEISSAILRRYHSCVLAYGQSATGKTHTMMGNLDEPGITPRLCKNVFRYLEETSRINGDNSDTSDTFASYLEIYNEKVRDLLDASCDSKPLRVREHPKKGTYVQGLKKKLVNDSDDLLNCLRYGNNNRRVAATVSNPQSSRSHSIFTVTYLNGVKLHLIDLAGSEKAGTKFSTSASTFREGANINKSLVALGNVISALVAGLAADRSSKYHRNSRKRYIPYRDSILTWLLKDTLGGNSKTVMIATISPSNACYSETVNTLRFGQRAKQIESNPIVNEDPKEKIIRDLHHEILRLKELLKISQGNIDGRCLCSCIAEEEQEALNNNSAFVSDKCDKDLVDRSHVTANCIINNCEQSTCATFECQPSSIRLGETLMQNAAASDATRAINEKLVQLDQLPKTNVESDEDVYAKIDNGNFLLVPVNKVNVIEIDRIRKKVIVDEAVQTEQSYHLDVDLIDLELQQLDANRNNCKLDTETDSFVEFADENICRKIIAEETRPTTECKSGGFGEIIAEEGDQTFDYQQGKITLEPISIAINKANENRSENDDSDIKFRQKNDIDVIDIESKIDGNQIFAYHSAAVESCDNNKSKRVDNKAINKNDIIDQTVAAEEINKLENPKIGASKVNDQRAKINGDKVDVRKVPLKETNRSTNRSNDFETNSSKDGLKENNRLKSDNNRKTLAVVAGDINKTNKAAIELSNQQRKSREALKTDRPLMISLKNQSTVTDKSYDPYVSSDINLVQESPASNRLANNPDSNEANSHTDTNKSKKLESKEIKSIKLNSKTKLKANTHKSEPKAGKPQLKGAEKLARIVKPVSKEKRNENKESKLEGDNKLETGDEEAAIDLENPTVEEVQQEERPTETSDIKLTVREAKCNESLWNAVDDNLSHVCLVENLVEDVAAQQVYDTVSQYVNCPTNVRDLKVETDTVNSISSKKEDFVPVMEVTSSVKPVKPKPPLRRTLSVEGKRMERKNSRLFGSQELKTLGGEKSPKGADLRKIPEQQALTDVTQIEAKVNSIRRDSPLMKSRTDLIQEVTQRLYMKVKKKDASTDTSDLITKSNNTGNNGMNNKLAVATNKEMKALASLKLKEFTKRAITAYKKRNKETQTYELPIRYKEVGTDSYDLPFALAELKNVAVYTDAVDRKDAATGSIYTEPIYSIEHIDALKSLFNLQQQQYQQFPKNLDNSTPTSKDKETSGDQSNAPANGPSKDTDDSNNANSQPLSFTKYLLPPHVEIANPLTANPIYTAAVNINVSHNYINSNNRDGVNKPTDWLNKTLGERNGSQFPTPDLISNHNNSAEGQESPVVGANAVEQDKQPKAPKEGDKVCYASTKSCEELNVPQSITSPRTDRSHAKLHFQPATTDKLIVDVTDTFAPQTCLLDGFVAARCEPFESDLPQAERPSLIECRGDIRQFSIKLQEPLLLKSIMKQTDAEESDNASDATQYEVDIEVNKPSENGSDCKRVRFPAKETSNGEMVRAVNDFMKEANDLMAHLNGAANNLEAKTQPDRERRTYELQINVNDLPRFLLPRKGRNRKRRTRSKSIEPTNLRDTATSYDVADTVVGGNKYESLVLESCDRLERCIESIERANERKRNNGSSNGNDDYLHRFPQPFSVNADTWSYPLSNFLQRNNYNQPHHQQQQPEYSSLESNPTHSDYGSLPRRTRRRSSCCSSVRSPPSAYLRHLTNLRQQIVETSREELLNVNQVND